MGKFNLLSKRILNDLVFMFSSLANDFSLPIHQTVSL